MGITMHRGRDQAAVNAAKQRYNERNYDQLKIFVRKGGRDIVHALAAASGMSTAEYVRHCIIADAKNKGLDISDSLGGGGVADTLAQIAALMLDGQGTFGL